MRLLGLAVTDIAVGLLVVAGAAKWRDPAALRSALWTLGLSRRRRWTGAIRALGTAEVAVGAAVVLVGGPVAFGALASSYAGFAVASQRLLAAGGASCGCFGERSAPVGRVHVVANAVVAALATILAFTDPASLVARLGPGV